MAAAAGIGHAWRPLSIWTMLRLLLTVSLCQSRAALTSGVGEPVARGRFSALVGSQPDRVRTALRKRPEAFRRTAGTSEFTMPLNFSNSTANTTETLTTSSITTSTLTTITTTSTSSNTTTTTVTSSSTTTSTSSTTSTATSDVQMISAGFAASYTQVLFRFSRAAESAGTVVPCSSVFHPGTLEAFGAQPTCRWSWDRMSLTALLGSGFKVIPGSIVSTLQTGLFFEGLPAASLISELQSEQDTVPPQAMAEATPPTTQACGEVRFSGVSSTGAYGHPLAYNWSLNEETSDFLRQGLEAAMADIGSVPSFLISADQLYTAMQGNSSNNSNSSGGQPQLVVDLEISNWLGATASTTTSVSVLTDGEVAPVLVPATSQSIWLASAAEPSQVGVTVLPADTCDGSFVGMGVDLTWEIRLDGTAWQPLQSAAGRLGTVDTSRQPRLLELPSFAFTHNSTQQLRVTGAFSGTPPNTTTTQVEFQITVGPLPAPVVVITGPMEVPPSCSFSLEAVASDPSQDPLEEPAKLSYEWSWEGKEENASWENGTAWLAVLASANTSRLELPGGLLEPQVSYNFTVITRQADGVQVEATWTVAVLESSAPPTFLATPWTELQTVSTSASLSVSATLLVTEGCTNNTTWQGEWLLVEAAPPYAIVTRLATSSSVASDGIMRVATSDFPGGALSPGSIYKYAFLASPAPGISEEQLLSVQNLSAALPGSSFATLSVSFTADSPPLHGHVQASPTFGETLTTQFSVSTSGWQDLGTLTYAIYRFPIPSNIALAVSDGRLSCTPACVLPDIDWTDRSSSTYWTKLGGVLLSVGRNSAVWGLVIPPGQYFLVARATDSLGATGTATVLGPLVTSGTNGFQFSEATRALARAVQSNDGDSLLNAVESVANAAGGTADAATQELLLANLEAASSLISVTTESIRKFSQVVQSLVGSLHGAAVDLERVTNATGSVIRAATSSGLSLEAGDAVLGSLSAIGISSASGGGVTGKETQLTARLLDKVAALGAAILVQASAGQVQELSASDPGGSGSGAALSALQRFEGEARDFGFTLPGFQVPAGALATGARRLTSSCSTLSAQQTIWIGTNIFHHAVASPFTLSSQPDLMTIEVRQCGNLITLNSTSPLSMVLPSRSWPTPTAAYAPHCLRYDTESGVWTPDQVTISSSVSTLPGSSNITCVSTAGSGTYVIGFLLITTTTTTSSTTTETFSSSTATTTDPNATTTAETTAPPAPWRGAPAPEEGLSAGMVVGMVIGCLIILAGLIFAFLGMRAAFQDRSRSMLKMMARDDPPPKKPLTPVEESDEEMTRSIPRGDVSPGGTPKPAWPPLPPGKEKVLAVPDQQPPQKSLPRASPGPPAVTFASTVDDVEPFQPGNRPNIDAEALLHSNLPPDTCGELLAYRIYMQHLAEGVGNGTEGNHPRAADDQGVEEAYTSPGARTNAAAAAVLRAAAAEDSGEKPVSLSPSQQQPSISNTPTLRLLSGGQMEMATTSSPGGLTTSNPNPTWPVPPETRGALLVCEFLEQEQTRQAGFDSQQGDGKAVKVKPPALPPLPDLAPAEPDWVPPPPIAQADLLAVEDLAAFDAKPQVQQLS